MKSLALAAVLTVASCQPVMAQETCLPTEDAKNGLDQAYGEVLHSYGLASDRVMIEILVNDETGTWTAMLSSVDGVSCILATGVAFTVQKKGEPT
jgi:predicted methyltransferase